MLPVKFSLVLVLGVVSVVAVEEKEKMAIMENCVKSSGVNPDDVMKLKDGQLDETPEMGSFMHCMFDKFGVIDDKGVINMEAVLTKVPDDKKEEVQKIMEKCSVTMSDAEAALTFVKCAKDDMKVLMEASKE